MIYFVLLLFSIILAHVQYMISKFNLLAPWSGYGAIEGVLNKDSDAPMVYRVLVPWMIGRDIKIWKYNLFQTVVIWGVLVSIYTAWGLNISLITMVILTMTFWYDYWDWSIEILVLTLALISFPLTLLGVTLHGLSRETAPLVGIVYALHSHDYLGGAIITIIGLLTLWLVRKIQGKHPLYCKRWMIIENINILKHGDVKAWLSISLVLVSLLSFTLPNVLVNHMDIFIVPIIASLGFTMAKVNETRVFVAITPYAALYISGLLK